MGDVKGLPVGLSFVGRAWEDARVLALGHGFEQAAGVVRSAFPRASVEGDPAVAPLLAPFRQTR
jgi:amidase